MNRPGGRLRAGWRGARRVLLGCVLGVSGCSTEAFCFDCQQSAITEDAGNTGTGGTAPDIQLGDSGPTPVDASGCGDTTSSVENCGACGNVCVFMGAIAACVSGQCVLDHCADGFVDLDQNATTGCECELSGNGIELCDQLDNDCDGTIDEDFDFLTNPEHCGQCNSPCPDLPHSTKGCVDGRCTYACETGYVNLSQGSLAGCTYACPVYPPVSETCNGVDDDCDGAIDDGQPGAGAECHDRCPGGRCVGECRPGTTVCTSSGSGLVCVGGTGPEDEVCDGHDNDCDGLTDEDFDLQTDQSNCGRCGVVCRTSDPCVSGQCQFACATGTKDLDQIPTNGCEYSCPVWPTLVETCNGRDDDCDGQIDEEVSGLGAPCTDGCPTADACVAAGDCSPFGIAPHSGACFGVCADPGATACVGGAIVCGRAARRLTEICNALDDNCDGRVDEGFDLSSDPLNCGTCGHICADDHTLAMACTGGACTSVTACELGYRDLNHDPSDGCEYQCPAWPPVGEVCNGIDDDCNGTRDDAVSGLERGCTSDCPPPDPCIAAGNCTHLLSESSGGCHGVCASDGIQDCTDGSAVCQHPRLGSETCNDLDDDCDGLVDEDFDLPNDPQNCGGCGRVCSLPGAVTHGCAQGICRALTCQPEYASVDGNPTNGCEYHCPVWPTISELCNGVDDDCDGQVDESPADAGQGCVADCPQPDPCVAAGTCSPYLIAPSLSGCYGACTTGGLTACVGGALVCTHPNRAANETCNGIDDNCDGRVDEGFDLSSDPANCGGCGQRCSRDHTAAMVCSAGACTGILTCEAGYRNLDGSVDTGCEYQCPVWPSQGESCNGVDDDCDKVVDDDVAGLTTGCVTDCPLPDPCIASGTCSRPLAPHSGSCYGVCAADGQQACVSASVVCHHPGYNGSDPCNGVDDDCDGLIDQDFDLQSDPNNCGGCGVVCSLPATAQHGCTGGICQVLSCQAGYANLDGTASNGCEYRCPVLPTTAETCNGLDDDCDGIKDESPSDVGSACQGPCPTWPCRGECRSGTWACVGGQRVCQGGIGPALEVCDNKDNDCDNQTDEGYSTQTDPQNCGSCGHVCVLPNAIAGCSGGQCTVTSCLPGFGNPDGAASNGCELTCPVYPTIAEVCNGRDDDCDGQVDESVTSSNFCTQTGPCAGAVPVCTGSTGWRCNYQTINPNIQVTANGALAYGESLCDGFDNNCNGQADEPFTALGQDCYDAALGECRDWGKIVCSTDKLGTTCDLSLPPAPALRDDEICNGLDDDCDEEIDEGIDFVGQGLMVAFPAGAPAFYVDRYEASRPDATDMDAGVSSALACSASDKLPWTAVTWPRARDACTARGPDYRLCTAVELAAVCQAGSNIYPYGIAYQPDACNGYGHDGDGVAGVPVTHRLLTTEALAGCKTSLDVFDLSGNATEWTSTSTGQTPTGLTIYQLHGGSYLSPELGLRCVISLAPREAENAVLENVGFRCCKDYP